jgi:hypothetical protein
VDTQGRESVETFEYEKPPLYCWNDLYWSDREKNEFTNAARLQVMEFVKRNHLRVRRMENAYERCADKSASERKKKEDMQSLLKWTASSGRGLEDSVSRLCWERRDAYRKDMIEFFAYLADSFVPGTDVDDEVRMFSECRTLGSREFAFKLALADELTLK